MNGSPPHTRGQASVILKNLFIVRITPAYAGTRSLHMYLPERLRDHPRIRGDKPALWPLKIESEGSPPHTRGQARSADLNKPRFRITPAYAGTSEHRWQRVRPIRDHPRIRGDKAILLFFHQACRGSPPHTRGQDKVHTPSGLTYGITPAYAGTSDSISGRSGDPEDHPRIRGDKVKDFAMSGRIWGSPPHTRGQVFKSSFSLNMFGITPAYAGTSWHHNRET